MRSWITIALLLLQFFVPQVFVSAQTPSAKDIRGINLALLGVLDEYDRTASFSEPNDKRDFLKLFADPDAPCIYNDIMGSSDFQESISPRQYVGSVPDNGSAILKTVISKVRKKGDVYFEDGLLHRKVSFSKYIMIIDTAVYTLGDGGILFDSAQNFDQDPDFQLVADFVYDPSKKTCFISSIEPEIKKADSPLDDNAFSVVLRSSSPKYDKQLSSRGEALVFNEFNQALAYRDDLDIDNYGLRAKVSENANGSNYNVLDVKVTPIVMRTKFYGDYVTGNSFDVQSTNAKITGTSKGFRAGVDLGLQFPLTGKWGFGFYGGAGFVSNTISFSADDISYSLDYVSPARTYKYSCSETVDLKDIVFPAYLENEIYLARFFTLVIDTGARFYLNQSTVLSPFTVVGNIGGVSYTDSNPKTFSSFSDPANYTREPFDITAFARLEADFCLAKKLLYLYLAYDYEWGIKPSYESSRPFFSQSGNVYPIYYSPGLDADIAFRSLIGSVTYLRKAGSVSAGLKIKF